MPAVVTVVVENKSNQLVCISTLVEGRVSEVKLAPHGSHGPIPFIHLTAYTRRLAELGRVFIRAQN